jgi:hypothetical protein
MYKLIKHPAHIASTTIAILNYGNWNCEMIARARKREDLV